MQNSLKRTVKIYVDGMRERLSRMLESGSHEREFAALAITQMRDHTGACDLETDDGISEAVAFTVATGLVLGGLYDGNDETHSNKISAGVPNTGCMRCLADRPYRHFVGQGGDEP
jgi:hypothetical protein